MAAIGAGDLGELMQSKFVSPLGDDLKLLSMKGAERISRLFQYDLELIGPKESIPIGDILGKTAHVELLTGGGVRFFHGHVTRFERVGAHGRSYRYLARLHPWTWFLTQVTDCRIFQEMSVPDIITQVLGDLGFSDHRLSLTSQYAPWEYNVQYRETAFNFISRLMEHEGIYYFFEHERDKHTMVFADSRDAHGAVDGYADVMFREHRGGGAVQDSDVIDQWRSTHEVQPSGYAMRAYDFKNPRTDLTVNAESSHSQGNPAASDEVYDWPGTYLGTSAGNAYAVTRLEELAARIARVHGGGTARGLAAGHVFTLLDHPVEKPRKFLVLGVTHELRAEDRESTDVLDAGDLYRCGFEAMEYDTHYRPERNTPKPVVQGPQTAVVVGPADDEIHVDEYGRVKVQFHWDRYGQRDENASCWIRVSNDWSGKQWGHIRIPRIGQEVIVSFLEGDPDQPIITGRVYNADHMPPYALPDNKTQSGVKSRSTPDGTASNFNEIRMEDKKGDEELFIQAEKNETINVKNDKRETIGNDETETVGNDRTRTVENDETVTVNNDETREVGHDRKRTVQHDETVDIMNDQHINVHNDYRLWVNKKGFVNVNEIYHIFPIEGLHIQSQRGYVLIGADTSWGAVSNQSMALEAQTEISLSCGPSSIEMTPAGITIRAPMITISSSGVLTAEGSVIQLN